MKKKMELYGLKITEDKTLGMFCLVAKGISEDGLYMPLARRSSILELDGDILDVIKFMESIGGVK